eukprot:1123939-Rhodomonas_salina.1
MPASGGRLDIGLHSLQEEYINDSSVPTPQDGLQACRMLGVVRRTREEQGPTAPRGRYGRYHAGMASITL